MSAKIYVAPTGEDPAGEQMDSVLERLPGGKMPAKIYVAPTGEAPAGEQMDRGPTDMLLFDKLGYGRVTRLAPHGWRHKCYNGLVCMRAAGICVLERILPNIPDPTIVQPINEGWSALKEIDEALGNMTCDTIQPLAQLGECTDTSFKFCLCIPCCENPATSLVFDGQTDYILNKPAGLKGLAFGPKVKTVESLFITDERSRCQRLCGCKKGKWTIYHGNTVVAKVLKGKKPCTCAGYYKMVDADGVLLSRIKISPTFCECLTQTCRKCTCQCCCLCRLCDCIRCKCCRTKPYLRIQAPTRKEEMMVFNKGKCCKKPKGKVMYRTLYVPGQGGAETDDDDDGKEEEEEPAAVNEKDDEPVDGGDATAKYNKQTNGTNMGAPGEKVKYYVKNPPYFCVGLSRDFKKMTCMSDMEAAMEELGIEADHVAAAAEEVGKAVDASEAVAAAQEAAATVAAAQEKVAAAQEAAQETVVAAQETVAAAAAQELGIGDTPLTDSATEKKDGEEEEKEEKKKGEKKKTDSALGKVGGKSGKLAGYKRVLDDCVDMQFGEKFTTAQKTGALLTVLWEMKVHQM